MTSIQNLRQALVNEKKGNTSTSQIVNRVVSATIKDKKKVEQSQGVFNSTWDLCS